MPHSLKNKIKSLCYKGEITEKERDRIIQALEQARPKGKWIDIGIAMEGRKYKNHECDMADAYYCDYCGYNQYIKTNYCPWCGAEMVGEEEK